MARAPQPISLTARQAIARRAGPVGSTSYRSVMRELQRINKGTVAKQKTIENLQCRKTEHGQVCSIVRHHEKKRETKKSRKRKRVKETKLALKTIAQGKRVAGVKTLERPIFPGCFAYKATEEYFRSEADADHRANMLWSSVQQMIDEGEQMDDTNIIVAIQWYRREAGDYPVYSTKLGTFEMIYFDAHWYLTVWKQVCPGEAGSGGGEFLV